MQKKGDHYNSLPDGLVPEELYEFLSKNADRFEPALKYSEALSEDDLNKFRAEFADEAIELNAQKAEMKEEISILKGRVKDIENKMASKLKVIAEKEIEIVENGFAFKDFESQQMIWCNAQGIIISTRLLEPEEMQVSIPLARVRSLHKKDKIEIDKEYDEVDLKSGE